MDMVSSLQTKGETMHRKPIEITELNIQPHNLFHNQWMLLTSGDFAKKDFNTMTISWGALGTMWSRPFAYVAVRYSRYTFEFMEKYDSFTLSAFPPEHKKALSLLGSRSGRDGDKISASGLTPQASSLVAAPCFQEAELVIECRKMYWNDLNPVHFLNEEIYEKYPNRDFHRIYYGEVLKIFAANRYIL
jgi:flavin reductase (DIM6/NTAB) family NADH-FMN oxidoreductase RutF